MARTNLRRVYTLTSQPEGPTGRELDKIAQDIVELAQENAAEILHNLVKSDPTVLDTIQAVRRGNEIVVGIRPDGPRGDRQHQGGYYLAAKEAREHVWLEPAVEAIMREHKLSHKQVGISRGPRFQ